MKNEIDWSKAPEGATHEYNGDFFMRDGGRWYLYRPSSSDYVFLLNPLTEKFTARPQQWTGPEDGLPPVGALVDAPINGARYMCELLAIDGDECAVRMPGAIRVVNLAELRYIRTPEQIAAEEREKAIKEIAEILGGLWSSEREAAGFLYDAGYRKTEGGAQ